jgi:hypothetical protein
MTNLHQNASASESKSFAKLQEFGYFFFTVTFSFKTPLGFWDLTEPGGEMPKYYREGLFLG